MLVDFDILISGAIGELKLKHTQMYHTFEGSSLGNFWPIPTKLAQNNNDHFLGNFRFLSF